MGEEVSSCRGEGSCAVCVGPVLGVLAPIEYNHIFNLDVTLAGEQLESDDGDGVAHIVTAARALKWVNVRQSV